MDTMLRHIAVLASAALSLLIAAGPAGAQAPEPRIALVIGNAAYASGPLQNALNDAGLVAEALRSIGFDIVDGADLGQADMVRTVRDFVGKVEAAGPGAVAFVYFSGYGFAYEGDNYLAAADARLERENEIPLDTVRLSDLLRALDGVPARGKVVAIDAARQLPFGIANAGLAPGLSALEAPSGMMIAYSTEPGQVFADSAGAYGPYATAIAEMVRTPGADIVDDFIRVRERVAQLSEGRQLPWNVSALGQPVVLVPGDIAPVASAALPPPPPLRQPRPMPQFGPDEGYAYVIERNELPLYAEYVEDYPDSPYAPQIWAIIRARREALCWMRAVDINTPEAYWTYRQRYPHGIYAFDSERRLHRLSAPLGPPSGFVAVEFAGVPPPLRREPAEFVHFYHAPHPFAPPPAALIHRQPVFFARLAPPPHQAGARVLPLPAALPVYPKLMPGQRFSAPGGAPLHPGNAAIAPGVGPGVGPGLAPTGLRQPGVFRPPGPPTAAVAPGLAPNVAPNVIPEHRPGERLRERPFTPPPAVVNRTSPAEIINQPPPPAVVNRPPPPVVTRPPPPPPPAIVNRAPPPPPPVVNRPPPPPAAVVARPAPAAAAKRCVIENGRQVCR
jgi:Caspase domain